MLPVAIHQKSTASVELILDPLKYFFNFYGLLSKFN